MTNLIGKAFIAARRGYIAGRARARISADLGAREPGDTVNTGPYLERANRDLPDGVAPITVEDVVGRGRPVRERK